MMKTFHLHKVATLVAALALASAGIAGDALAHGGGGGGGGGGGWRWWHGRRSAVAAWVAAVTAVAAD